MRQILFCLLVSISIVQTGFAENRRDGNWWNSLDDDFKYSYIVGIYDGLLLGNNFSLWGISSKTDCDCVSEAISSFYDYNHTYMSNVTNGQIVDGLNEFYKDFRNRRIRVGGAIWIVVKDIAGTPKEEMEKLIESWRANTY
jgi:hypothetical protein